MVKTKDLFLNIAANPNMTLEDLASVGLTSENTMLLDRALYASNEKVQDMFRDEEGNFDEQKFNATYDLAEQSYNILANDETNLNLINVTAYDSDNIFVDPSKRKRENKPYAVKLPNPDRLNVGVTRIGKIGPRTLSLDEIAQTQQVLLNPTGVANGEKPIYGSSPNESWFEDFWDTRVMAAWDEDGTHIDPVTGKETQHKKGDLKLNENGTYYYESLDGRSVYGKRILNKFNTLTTDGSVWNKYDFFDSDSIELKSIGGSVLKNLALVGSMFIPYVGWGVAAASIAHQMAGLTATFGKMLAGSDSPTLDAIEGWVKSTDRRNLKTEYAQQNMWCWENFIDLIGDTTAQLREQRAIFKFAPGIIKRDFKALNEKALKEYEEKLTAEYLKNGTNMSFRDLVKLAHRQNPENASELLRLLYAGAKDIYSSKAQKAVRQYLDDYYKLGEPIAKAYMTAITVQDTFGEAILAGASDSEATLLTLGYAAAEAALLSTDLGKWIMPELRTNKLRHKMMAKKLLELSPETRELSKQVARLDGDAKKTWAKKLFNIGKDIANAEYSMMAKTVGTVAALGLGEGIEEVSEEALADFSKSCFNLVQLLQGDNVRMNAWNHNWDWEEAANRYGMSFAGGIMGGSINAAASDYNAGRDIANMTSQQVLLQLVYMTRNNELDDFWKTINKTTLASKELSTQVNDNGIGYKPGTKEDNQDLEAKRALKKLISLIESIINSENAKLNDGGLLSVLTLADPSLKDLDPVKEYRMRALANSATAGRFLNEWNTVISDIVSNRLKLLAITSKYGDSSSEKYSDTDNEELKNLGKSLKILQERKDKMLDGSRTREYVRDALFEMTHPIKEEYDDMLSEARYAESKTGKKFKDLSEEQQRSIHEEYEKIKNSNLYAEKIHALADIYETLAISASLGILSGAEFYEQIRQLNYLNIVELDKVVSKRLNILQEILNNPDKGVTKLLELVDKAYEESAQKFGESDGLASVVQQIDAERNTERATILVEQGKEQLSPEEELMLTTKYYYKYIPKVFDLLYDKINQTHDEFLLAGFIHPEVKEVLKGMTNTLSIFGSNLQTYYDPYSEYDTFEGDFKDMDLSDSYAEKWQLLDKRNEELNNLTNSPIVENLGLFQLSTTTDRTALDLINYLLKQDSDLKKDLSAFLLDSSTILLFEDAEKLLKMYRSAIVGARVDNIDIDTIVGFNSTLNEISGENETPKLAEIDSQTADLVLEDINKVLKRLNYAKSLHGLNVGNKYSVQDKTALNKNYILFNKIKHFVSILGDKWNDELDLNSLQELNEAINKADVLHRYSGYNRNYDDRTFTITPDEKEMAENLLLDIQKALHNFFKDRIDGSDTSINKLAEFLNYDNYKGLIRENNDFLNLYSVDIDDSAFIWWMCATAALDPDLFYINYNQIIGYEQEGEKPIAPIPTQELGVFTLTAAIANGDMFSTFSKALRKSLTEFWDSLDDTKRSEIENEYGNGLLKDSNKIYFKNNNFLPNFENIVFVEGIAGSGKTTAVLKTLSKILSNSNPDFAQQNFIFAHTDTEKAKDVAKSTEFKNYEVHDHDSLMKYISSTYKNPVVGIDKKTGRETVYYELDKDVILVEGILRSNHEINLYNPNEVPKVMFIDEWSHYNQIEQELIQRFALAYGTTVVVTGDYDLLTPNVDLFNNKGEGILEVTPDRNMTPRVAKLGVSMRTDNETKNGNMYRMLAWKLNPTNTVELHYYEDDNGIYGDKLYKTNLTYDSLTLDRIKLDVQKMISTLKDNLKIGYVYDKTDSELYTWITTTSGIKEHITPYQEKDAHGREAQYYIIENKRESGQDALSYFNSVYTGITRSELGSIIIANTGVMTNSSGNKYNSTGISFTGILDSEMQPNTFTDEGTRDFTRKRKKVLDNRYGGQLATPFNIIPRTRKEIILNRTPILNPTQLSLQRLNAVPPQQLQPSNNTPLNNTPSNGGTSTTQGVTLLNTLTANSLPTNSTPQSNVLPLLNPIDDSEELPPFPENGYIQGEDNTKPQPGVTSEDLGDTRTPEPVENWKGPLSKGQKLYSKEGIADWIIIGEHDDPINPEYTIRNLWTDVEANLGKSEIHDISFLNLPQELKLFNVNDKVIFLNHKIHTINSIILDGPKDNPYWVYNIGGTELEHSEVLELISKGLLKLYEDPNSEPIEEVEEYSGFDTDGTGLYQNIVNEEFNDPNPNYTSGKDNGDINFDLLGFTFNNFYLADEFDKDGDIVINDWDRMRIDNGYGLFKLNGVRYKNKKDIERDLGEIRKYLYFKSNLEIIGKILELTDASNLSIRWGFISKTDSLRDDKFSRYNLPNAKLEYMALSEDTYIPRKTLAAIIYQSGRPILELPVITLLSPLDIFIRLKEAKLANDITRLWKFSKKEEGETKELLDNIKKAIDENHPEKHVGYHNLKNLINLWLFTSNGFKHIKGDNNLEWNLHEYMQNIGNLYITYRESDNGAFDYSGDWRTLEEASRSDRFISPILMNRDDTFIDEFTGKTVKLFRRRTPYVFLSDSPDITNTEDAAKQWLKQLANPNVEKIVKLIPVIPPQIKVSEYIEAMNRIAKGESTNEPYGNKFTPYRIWSDVIMDSQENNQPFTTADGVTYATKKDFIVSLLGDDVKANVFKYVELLNNCYTLHPLQKDESKLDYQVRMANLLNPILEEFVNYKRNQIKVYEFLRRALIDCCRYNPIGDDTRILDEILDQIDKICTSRDRTGVLCRPSLNKNQAGRAIAGFVYTVNTEGPFNFPRHGLYRIFSKIDPPTYILNNLFDSIKEWALDAKLGITVTTKSGKIRSYPNVWRFENSEDSLYLTDKQDSNIPMLDLSNVRNVYKKLLDKLGMNDYNIEDSELENHLSESDAIETAISLISKEFVSRNPGSFYIFDNTTKKYKYGKLSEFLPEYADFIFQKSKYDNSGKTLLTFLNPSTNLEEVLEIEVIGNNQFEIRPLILTSQSELLKVEELKNSIIKELEDNPIIEAIESEYGKITDLLLACYDVNTNQIDLNTIAEILKDKDSDTLDLLSEIFIPENLDSKQLQDTCINPIKISFI